MGGDEDEGQSEEGGADAEDSGGGSTFAERWGWIANVDAVSETCRCSWDDVWQMKVIEFLNILSYRREKMDEQKRQMEQWRKTH